MLTIDDNKTNRCHEKEDGTKPNTLWISLSRVSENRTRLIRWHRDRNHDDGVSFLTTMRDRGARGGGWDGLVTLTLIVLKLAVVWTAKRIFYSQQNMVERGREKEEDKNRKNTTPVKSSMETPKVCLCLLQRPTKTLHQSAQRQNCNHGWSWTSPKHYILMNQTKHLEMTWDISRHHFKFQRDLKRLGNSQLPFVS